MQRLPDVSKFDTSILPVIGMLAAAGTAKLGYGQWAAGGLALFIAVRLGAAATAILTRQLSAWITRLETQQQRALVRVRGTAAFAYGEE
jgi:hypothetical protein